MIRYTVKVTRRDGSSEEMPGTGPKAAALLLAGLLDGAPLVARTPVEVEVRLGTLVVAWSEHPDVINGKARGCPAPRQSDDDAWREELPSPASTGARLVDRSCRGGRH